MPISVKMRAKILFRAEVREISSRQATIAAGEISRAYHNRGVDDV